MGVLFSDRRRLNPQVTCSATGTTPPCAQCPAQQTRADVRHEPWQHASTARHREPRARAGRRHSRRPSRERAHLQLHRPEIPNLARNGQPRRTPPDLIFRNTLRALAPHNDFIAGGGAGGRSVEAPEEATFSIFPHANRLFISYSHSDAILVKPFVDYTRAANKDLVFFDRDSIAPGEKWSSAIAMAILRSDRMFVFWCHHSAKSEEVRKEYQAAIGAKKPVVPTLLDSTPLPAELGANQWCDMREAVAKTHSSGDAQKNSLLQDPGIHQRMSLVFLQFLANERTRAR